MRSAWGLEVERDVDWRQRAACGPDSAEWFWLPARSGPWPKIMKLGVVNKLALDLCRRCPVVADCVRYEQAHPTPDPHIAGGLVWAGGGPRMVSASG